MRKRLLVIFKDLRNVCHLVNGLHIMLSYLTFKIQFIRIF